MDCIFLAAGLGLRMKEAKPKQFLTLLGKPLFVHALEIIERVEAIERILLMFHPEFESYYREAIERHNIGKVELVEGGLTRHRSVRNGLAAVRSSRVLIHEAARPFITQGLIEDLLGYADDEAVIPTIPIPFTVSVGGDFMEDTLDRKRLHNIQLPQVFDTDLLRRAHGKAETEGFEATEDGIVVFRAGGRVRFVPGTENNVKVTTPMDLILAERMIRGPYQ